MRLKDAVGGAVPAGEKERKRAPNRRSLSSIGFGAGQGAEGGQRGAVEKQASRIGK